jgi:acyl-CoA thioester hydrolase
MANEIFRCTHRVTYAECTVGNHVYYSRFLDLLEGARGELFRSIGTTFLQWQQAGLAFPVLECQLHYKGPARYDDLLTIEVWLTQLQRVRLGFAYHILNEERKTVLEAATHHICASIGEKPRRLPENLLGSLQAYLHQVTAEPEDPAQGAG